MIPSDNLLLTNKPLSASVTSQSAYLLLHYMGRNFTICLQFLFATNFFMLISAANWIGQQRVSSRVWQQARESILRNARIALVGLGIGLSSVACGDATPTPTMLPPTPLATSTPIPVATVEPTAATGDVPYYTYVVVQTYPHDPAAFTQGLLFDEGILYEGTGLYGASTLRQVALESGAVQRFTPLPEAFFGEGITIVGERLYQLTWREQTGFIYDKATFEVQQQFTYPTEGWGLTYDGERIIMSDGSARLYFWDPETLKELGTVDVYDASGPVTRLNELEFIHGEVFANIWQTDLIARIDPTTGQVVGWIDLSGLLPQADRTPSTDVLNGIAYLPEGNRLFVTGKLWPKLFEIRLLPKE